MKNILIGMLLAFPVLVRAQLGEKFSEGYMVDRFGQRFDGFLRLEPGDGKKPAELIFRESKKGKKEMYGPGYLRSFKIESDSFTVVKNIPLANRKILEADLVKVVLVGSGGVLYLHELVKEKSSGHAATEYKIEEESTRYLAEIGGKLISINKSNFRELAPVVADHDELKTKIQNRKLGYSALPQVLAEYKSFKSKQRAPQQ